jgi:integrase
MNRLLPRLRKISFCVRYPWMCWHDTAPAYYGSTERVPGMFKLADTKNDEPRYVPIHPRIASAAKVKMRDPFWMSKRFKEAAIAVGLGAFRFHDLRHSAPSAMINEEVDLYTVGAVLGHKSAQSTQRYSHLATKALKAAIGKIGKKVPTAKKMRVA